MESRTPALAEIQVYASNSNIQNTLTESSTPTHDVNDHFSRPQIKEVTEQKIIVISIITSESLMVCKNSPSVSSLNEFLEFLYEVYQVPTRFSNIISLAIFDVPPKKKIYISTNEMYYISYYT